MYQATLSNYIRHRLLDRFQDTFVSVRGDTFDLHTEFYQIVKIFLDLLVVFAVRKPNQLRIAILAVLITHHAELLEVSRV